MASLNFLTYIHQNGEGDYMALTDNRISVSFPKETKEKLEQLAQKKEWSLAQTVREAVKIYIQMEEE
jgi:predicted DNA-binding protein